MAHFARWLSVLAIVVGACSNPSSLAPQGAVPASTSTNSATASTASTAVLLTDDQKYLIYRAEAVKLDPPASPVKEEAWIQLGKSLCSDPDRIRADIAWGFDRHQDAAFETFTAGRRTLVSRFCPLLVYVHDIAVAAVIEAAAKEPFVDPEALCPGTSRLVAYFVEGTATGVDITITNQGGNIEQATGKAVPLQTSEDREGFIAGCFSPGDFASILAQNTGDRGTVICYIEVDGRRASFAQSAGAYVIASCDAVIP